MIKLLIVDDESVTRKGLIKHIDWDMLGIHLIEEAKDGMEGLEIARRMKPNIVISDIRMPKVDGIKFAVQLRKMLPECRIIFLSGYSDKEYLKAAIRLNAVSYVEKPINIGELQDAVQTAVDRYLEDVKKRQTEKDLNSAFSSSLPYIKQNIVHNLIDTKSSYDMVLKDLQLVGVPFEADDSYTVSIMVPSYMGNQGNEVKLACCNEIISFLENSSVGFKYIAAIKDLNQIIVISSHKSGERDTELFTIYNSIKSHICKEPGICTNLTWTVGPQYTGFLRIRASYEKAVQTLSKIFFLGHGNIYFYDEIPSTSYKINADILTSFSELLQEPEKNKIEDFIRNLYVNIKINRGTPIREIKNLFFKMTFLLFNEAKKRGLPLDESYQQEEKYLWDLVSKFETLNELKEYLMSRVNALLYLMEEIHSSSRAIMDVKAFIQNNYGRPDLSVKMLADHVYLTPTYLSCLFKEKTGNTLSKYITEVRIEKSLSFLVDPQTKLFEIAKKTGYRDANHFSKVFKKQMGLTPSEFRTKYKQWDSMI